MKTLIISFLAIFGFANLPNISVEKQANGNFEPIAVLELFTSQGCSSCPSADALLNKIIKENHSQKIIGLSFHVDYWNHLGWSDPYSSSQFTDRQSYYNAILKSGVYTPQIVVNGDNQFVGSSKNEAEKNIKNALSMPATLAIDLTFSEKKLSYNLHGMSANFNFSNCILNIAIVQNEATNFVKKGENGGKTLTHNNVVRYFEKQKIHEEKGEIAINLPENASKIIVFAQNSANGKILGATEIAL